MASTPSPTPSARKSLPSPASRTAQKSIRSLSCRLYRLTVRSRAKSAAATLFSSRDAAEHDAWFDQQPQAIICPVKASADALAPIGARDDLSPCH